MHKAVITLNTGMEDAETVTVAFLVAVGAAEQGRQTLIFLTKEAVRLATEGFARAVACDGCPPLADLVCPICMQARNVDPSGFVTNAAAGGTAPMWEWIGDDPAVTFSY
jgi:hypothetical protein